MYIQLGGILEANCVCFSFFCLTSEGGAKGRAEPRRVSPATDDSILNRALVLCNPATSGPSDSDARNPEPPGGFHLPAAAPQQDRDEDASRPEDVPSQMSEESCTANLGRPTAANDFSSSSGRLCDSVCRNTRRFPHRWWRRRSDHMSCFTVWLIQDPHVTWRRLPRGRSACCCPFLERPFWLWSLGWPCWRPAQSACEAPESAASWFTWILASLYWLCWFCLPHASHRSGLRHRWQMFTSAPAVFDLLWLLPTLPCRCPDTGCCCCRPHHHTFPFQTSSRGLRASLVCRLCTTCISGS